MLEFIELNASLKKGVPELLFTKYFYFFDFEEKKEK